MQGLFDILVNSSRWVSDLGAMIILPIGLFLTGVAFRLKAGKAFVNALRVGIGYFGLTMVMRVMGDQFGPLASAFAEKTGLGLSIPDVGVGIHFPIALSLPAAAFMIPLGILVNIIMLKLKLTKTVDLDVWNFWTWMFSWACVQGATGNAFYGFLAFVFTGAVSLVLGDLQAKYIHEYYDLPGVSFPHSFSTFFGLLAWPFMWLFDRIPGLKDWEINVEEAQKKLGPFGNSIVIGFILGGVIAAAAGYNLAKTLQTGVITAAMLFLIPEMLKHLSSGFFPLSEAVRKYLTEKFPGETYYIGMDCAAGVTQPSSIVVGMLLTPITFILALFLPGNHLLPLADIAFLGFWVAMPMAMFKNNVLKGVIFGTVAIAISLWMASSIAPLLTELAVSRGAISESAGQVSVLTLYPWAWVTTWLSSFLTGGI